ncbi:Protein disulfide isomerase-like 1-4 [Hordeum vulgare]|nr:Protein disulfide isomerase-like 1-4 [Hordeum vulgare]
MMSITSTAGTPLCPPPVSRADGTEAGVPSEPKILLFVVAKESSKFLPILKETAKSFKGKLLFVFVERDNEEVGEPVANYFGITGQETMVLAYTRNEDANKFFFSGEISLDNIKVISENILANSVPD